MNTKEIFIVVILALLLILGGVIFSGKERSEPNVDPESPTGEDQEEEDLMEVGIDQEATLLDVAITPLEVVEDSRCPVDVQCVQAGTVRVRALLSSGLGEGDQIFELGQPITTEAETVTLVRVEPVPSTAAGPIESDDYLFYFQITKR